MKIITITTPENISLDYELAGIGSRMVGAVVDHLLQLGIVAVISLSGILSMPVMRDQPLAQFLKSTHLAMILVITFLIMFGYFVFFEAIWSGQTPGKKLAQIQVIRASGQPAGFTEALVRNIFRLVDFLPVYYLTGILVIFFSPANRRLGDVVAGTLVVRLKDNLKPAVLPDLQVETDIPIDLSTVTGESYALVRNFLLRRENLNLAHRARLGKKITRLMAEPMGLNPEKLDPEEFLEAVAVEYRRNNIYL